MNIFDSTVTSWLKIFGSIIFMLLCLSGYRYGLQIAAAGFMAFAIKFFANSLMPDDQLKRRNINIKQMNICGIVCGLASWILIFYLKKSDGSAVIMYFTFAVLVINAIVEWLWRSKNIKIVENTEDTEDTEEEIGGRTSSYLIFLVLFPALMLIAMAFSVHIFASIMILTMFVLVIRIKQHGVKFVW